MRPSHRSISLAVSIALLGAGSAIAQGTAQDRCRPALALTDVRVSPARDLQRTWTATLLADASRCAATSGRFEVQFTRQKEYGPDMWFAERFTWQAGRSDVSIDIWWDEWLEEHRITQVSPCPCREQMTER